MWGEGDFNHILESREPAIPPGEQNVGGKDREPDKHEYVGPFETQEYGGALLCGGGEIDSDQQCANDNEGQGVDVPGPDPAASLVHMHLLEMSYPLSTTGIAMTRVGNPRSIGNGPLASSVSRESRESPMKRTVVVFALMVAVAGCGAAPESFDQPDTGTSTPASIVITTTSITTPITVPPRGATMPWDEPGLAISVVPAVLIEQWNAAENRQWCSALFPEDSTTLAAEALIRSANFGGGWAVAWDLPAGPGRHATGEYCADCGRGAYGIAGIGSPAVGTETDRWPTTIDYADGSKLGYGYEGDAAADSGAPLLAYLLVQDEGCSYNIWSFLGEDHLLDMIDQLRRVDDLRGDPTPWLSELPPPEVVALGDPPWQLPALAAEEVPQVAHEEWAEAGSPGSCPMLFYEDLGDATGAVIRHAANEGEMLVAWDLSDGAGHAGDSSPCEDCGRGVIGLGTFQHSSYEGPLSYNWSDGSEARLRTGPYSYGVEAFVSIAGFSCDYWMWSHLGEGHLEYLFSQLRRVDGSP